MELTAETLRGVYSAIVTPFKSDETIDEEALRKQTEYVIDNGCQAIMSTGGTGEFPHMTRAERKEATSIIVDQTGGRIPVIAGTAGGSTREAVFLSQDAQEVGAAAAILTPTYYFKIPEAGLKQHFFDVAESVDISVVIYNNPLYTGNPMSPQLMAEIMRQPEHHRRQAEPGRYGATGRDHPPDLRQCVRQHGNRQPVLPGALCRLAGDLLNGLLRHPQTNGRGLRSLHRRAP